jgi:RNA polymerase sigma factor (sigma-70 family)
MSEDRELLRQYAEDNSESAFGTLVSRHLPLVYSAALRQVCGDEQLAKDVAQAVFTDLARKARSLSHCEVLSGWLYTSTRFAAAKAVRTERRRQQRERVAMTMHEQTCSFDAASESDWAEICPVLDQAMAQLGTADRNVVLLRFFEGKELKAIGAALGISEDAARMRVNRALEKLRTRLRQRKINCASASLGALLLANAAQAAPAGLAASLATAAVGGATAGAGISFETFLHVMASTKLKIAVTTVMVAGVTTPLVLQHHALSRLRAENVALRQQAESAQPLPWPEPSPPEATGIGADQAEVLRLRGQVATLRNEREELARKLATINATTNKSRDAAPPATEGAVDTAWVRQVVAGPPSFQGNVAGSIRGKGLREGGRGITASEAAVQKALLERQLNNTLERSPADFAEFQTAFIQAAVGIDDPGKVEQIRQIIRQTYEEAVARGLDVPSKPPTDTEEWARARWQLDHANTKAVKALLTPEERKLFGRGFIGIMGVDLGGIGVDKSNYPPGVIGP